MSEKPIGISGTRRQIRELVDGSLEVRIHIDPRFKADFHKLFPEIDTPVALAPLKPDFEYTAPEEKPKGGPLCKLAAQWCKDPVFREWLSPEGMTEATTAAFMRAACGVKSRSEIDHNDRAARVFNETFRIPFMNFLKTNLKESNVQ